MFVIYHTPFSDIFFFCMLQQEFKVAQWIMSWSVTQVAEVNASLKVQWYLLIRSPFDSNTSQSVRILFSNPNTNTDAAFLPVSLALLRCEHLSLCCA